MRALCLYKTKQTQFNFNSKNTFKFLPLELIIKKEKRMNFIDSMENNAKILDRKSDENRRINAHIMNTR